MPPDIKKLLNLNSFAHLLIVAVMAVAVIQSCGSDDSFDDDCDPETDRACVCRLSDDLDTVVNECISGATDDGKACVCGIEDDVDPDPEPEPEPEPPPNENTFGEAIFGTSTFGP